MILNHVAIDDTFAEAFDMKAVRLLITADSQRWALEAAQSMTGFATSVIACGCEAGVLRTVGPDRTPDQREGVHVALFSVSSKELEKQTIARSGQCVMTCPTTALFAGDTLAADSPASDTSVAGVSVADSPASDTPVIDTKGEPIKIGAALRYFGDGHQIAKRIDGRRYWRIPVMDGEFLCEDKARWHKAIGGGNFLILARSRQAALAAAGRAAEKMRGRGDVILPFPGGVVRSGSKIGSRYAALKASTNDDFCPTLKGKVPSSDLEHDVASVMEIVFNGWDHASMSQAMADGIRAVCDGDQERQIVRISAGNYGGKLGRHHFRLREVLA